MKNFKSYLETEVAVALNPKIVKMAKQAMAKPNASDKQIASFLTRLLKEELKLQEQIKKNKK